MTPFFVPPCWWCMDFKLGTWGKRFLRRRANSWACLHSRSRDDRRKDTLGSTIYPQHYPDKSGNYDKSALYASTVLCPSFFRWPVVWSVELTLAFSGGHTSSRKVCKFSYFMKYFQTAFSFAVLFQSSTQFFFKHCIVTLGNLQYSCSPPGNNSLCRFAYLSIHPFMVFLTIPFLLSYSQHGYLQI